MTAERQAELAQYREASAVRDQERVTAGQLVDGVKEIREAWARKPESTTGALPEVVMAGRGIKGQRPKRVALRRA
jgi:hypothetical protein